jgi:hypothetical protein
LIDRTGKELTAICYDYISEPDKLGNRELKIINTRIVNFMNKSQDIERCSVRGIVK